MLPRQLLASVLIGATLAGASVASAQEPKLFFAADAAGDRGYLRLFVFGSSYADVEIGERIGPAIRPVATVNLGELPGLGFGGLVSSARCGGAATGSRET